MTEPVGSFFGYHLVLKGDAQYAGQYQAWELPSGIPIVTGDPETVLNRRLAHFTLDSIVRAAGWVTSARLWQPQTLDERVSALGYDSRTIFLPFLMRRMVREAILQRSFPDEVDREIELTGLKRVEDAIWASISPADRTAAKTQSEVWSLFLRMMQAQYTDQTSLHLYLYKTHVALVLDTIREAASLGLDLSKAYRAAYGCTFEDVTFVSFVLSAFISKEPGSVFDPADTDLSGFGISEELLSAYWRHCSIDYAVFAKHAKSPKVVMSGYESYALSPTVKWPLIALSNGMFAVPMAGDLLHRSWYGFAIDSMQAIEKADIGRFNVAQGSAFEKYVGRTLQAMSGSGSVTHADTLFKSGQKRCDWVCQEGKNVLLVECKAIRFDLDADTTKSRDRLKEEIDKEGGLADAIEQLNASARAIRDRETAIARSSRLMGLVVISGQQVGLNSPLFDELVNEVLRDRGTTDQILKYQVSNGDEFALIARRFRDGGSLWRFLRTKWDTPARRHDDLHTVTEGIGADLPGHPLADVHDEEFLAMMAQYSEELAEKFRSARALLAETANGSP